MHSRIIQMVAIPAGILLLAGKAIALFGFGKQSAGPTTEEAEAKSRAVEMIRASIAADDFVPPAKGVKRQDAKKFIEARELGNFSCGESVVAWDRVNDDWCDCSDGSDEPGTSACSKGEYMGSRFDSSHRVPDCMHSISCSPSARINSFSKR